MYLTDLLDKQRVNVIITKVNATDLGNSKAFKFDWKSENKFEVYQLVLTSTGETLGLISLNKIFEELRIEIRLIEIQKANIGKNKRYDRIAGILIAYACKSAFDTGFYGFVSLIPKTELIEHYKNKYGFKQFGRQLALQFESSARLMNKYLTDE